MFAEEFVFQGDATMESAAQALASTAQDASTLTKDLAYANDVVSTIAEQLQASPVYHRAITSLQQLIAADGVDGQILLKAVSLEAVRLTLQAIEQRPVEQSAIDPAAASTDTVNTVATDAIPTNAVAANSTVASPKLHGATECPMVAPPSTPDAATAADSPVTIPQSNLADDETLDNDVFSAIETVVQPQAPRRQNPFTGLLNRYQARRQTAVEEVQVFTRAEMLTQIGAQIQLEREQKGLTIAQLHARTFIPMYHLQALEGGHVEQLPEDVYLRGFLRRIENALGLEVNNLIDKLPSHEASKSSLPCWAGHSAQGSRRGFGGLDINPNHLYLTYAAIMAGGVYWLSNQTTPTAAHLPDLTNYEPRAEAPKNQPRANFTANQQASKSQSAKAKSVKVGSAKHIAPPEILR